MPAPETRRHRILRVASRVSLAVAVAASVLFGLLRGCIFGVSNHNSYLFGGLRLIDPELYTKDWLVARTTDYHHAFEYISWALLVLSPRGVAFAVAGAICAAAYCLVIYWIVVILVPRRDALSCFLLVMAVNFATGTSSAGTSYITEGILQPSSFGTLGILAAIAFFLRGRWLLSGVALALGGLLHQNYAVLGLLVFGAAHLVLREDGRLRRLAAQVAPCLPVLWMLAPLILVAATDPGREAAREILFRFRSPHHYSPVRYGNALLAVAGLSLLGAGTAGDMIRRTDRVAARIRAVCVGFLVVIWGGLAATTVLGSSSAQGLFVARLCPFSDVLFEILACAGVARLLRRPGSIRPLKGLRKESVVLVLVGLGLLFSYWGRRRGVRGLTDPALVLGVLVTLVALVVVVVIGSLLIERLAPRWRSTRVHRHRRWVVALVSACVLLGFALPGTSAASFGPRIYTPEHELFEWIRDKTPKDAIFLSPPDLESFRFQSRRAIVVDWKTHPFVPQEFLEWYDRISDVAGRRVAKASEAAAGYAELDGRRLRLLRSKYEIEYVVVRRESELAASPFRRAFVGQSYVVLDVGK